MKCYYLVYCYRDADNYDAYTDHAEHGVWGVKDDALRRAEELNQKPAKEWDARVRKARQEVSTRQQRWDALNAAGLSEGTRPQLNPVCDKAWSPGVGGISYYEVEETDFFPPNASKETTAESDCYAGDCTTCGGPVFHREGKPGEYDHECRQPTTRTCSEN
jgi:hypothetical protein